MSVRRIWQVTQLLLREAWHLRAGGMLVALGAGLAGLAGLLEAFRFGSEQQRFLLGVAEVTLRVGGVALLALLGAGLFHGGLAARGATLLFVRGVSRTEWLASLWLVLLVVAAAATGVAALALAGLLALGGHGGALGPALAALALGAGPLVIMAGVVPLAAAVARTVPLTVLLAAGVALAGQLAPIVRFARARASGGAETAWALLDFAVPDFSVFVPGGGPALAAYAAGYSLAALGVAAWLLRRREL